MLKTVSFWHSARVLHKIYRFKKFLEEATAKLRKNGMLAPTGLSYYRVMNVLAYHESGLRLRSALICLVGWAVAWLKPVSGTETRKLGYNVA
jgi:hypothetical protein